MKGALTLPPDTSLVDSNLLLRGAQPTHPLFLIADAAVAKLRMNGGVVYTCPQNSTEFWAVATRPLAANGVGLTVVQAEAALLRFETLFPMLVETAAIYPAWRRLVIGAGVSGRQVYDARILAIAQVYGMGRLLTFNTKDFTRYAALAPDVQITDPAAGMKSQIHNTTLEVVRGSVLEQDVEAIVNAANTAMRGGGGVDGAIHRAAGQQMMHELVRVAPHGAKTGTAVLTRGHALKQPYVIHTPGPVWNGGTNGEPEKLASSYRACLELADKKRLRSIAFCSISTGIYRYPLDLAAALALRTVSEYVCERLDTALDRIVFAMFQEAEYQAFEKALASLEADCEHL